MINRFNIRVYGLLTNERQELLVADELIRGQRITKLPGGGLEFGEGLADGLRREFLEELGLPVRIVRHFYTTDFFQASAFHSEHQVISVYYLVSSEEAPRVRIAETPFDFSGQPDPNLTFRWVPLGMVNEDTFTLPIDRVVGKMIATELS